MISRSAADLKAGQSGSPGCVRWSQGSAGPSSRTAGRQRISHWSAARPAIFRNSRPARSSRCQRVWVSTIQASAESRVYRSLVYHSQTRCRMTGLSASSRLPKGSSMIAPSAGLPAIELPTPAERRLPRRPGISKRSMVRRASSLARVPEPRARCAFPGENRERALTPCPSPSRRGELASRVSGNTFW